MLICPFSRLKGVKPHHILRYNDYFVRIMPNSIKDTSLSINKAANFPIPYRTNQHSCVYYHPFINSPKKIAQFVSNRYKLYLFVEVRIEYYFVSLSQINLVGRGVNESPLAASVRLPY